MTATFRDQYHGEYTEEQLDRLERMMDSDEYPLDDVLETLSGPTGIDANDQSSGS